MQRAKLPVNVSLILLSIISIQGCNSSADSPNPVPDMAALMPSSDGGAMDMSQALDSSLSDAIVLRDAMLADVALDTGPISDFGPNISADGRVDSVDLGLVDQGPHNEDAEMNMPRAAPRKVLFIGNSFTFWHDGLDSHMEGMRASADGAEAFRADQVVRGGASLEVMWNETNARNRIERGNYDVVILQEDIPETNVESFHIHARLFDQAIRESGATPLLYMAWDYRRLNWISMDEIAEAHYAIAQALNIPVAPAGLAWKRSQRERPRLNMYDDDDEHPSIHGAFLTTSTIYAVLFGENPEGLSYRPDQAGGVSDEDAAFLQRIAWEEVQAH